MALDKVKTLAKPHDTAPKAQTPDASDPEHQRNVLASDEARKKHLEMLERIRWKRHRSSF